MRNVAKFKVCERCGSTFAPRSNSAKWCDGCCTYKCEWCGAEFKSRRNRSVRCCSLTCTTQWQQTQKAKEAARKRTISKRGRGKVVRCETCQQPFYAPGWLLDKGGGRYCSRLCRRISVSLECPVCGKGFSRPPSDLRTFNY